MPRRGSALSFFAVPSVAHRGAALRACAARAPGERFVPQPAIHGPSRLARRSRAALRCDRPRDHRRFTTGDRHARHLYRWCFDFASPPPRIDGSHAGHDERHDTWPPATFRLGRRVDRHHARRTSGSALARHRPSLALVQVRSGPSPGTVDVPPCRCTSRALLAQSPRASGRASARFTAYECAVARVLHDAVPRRPRPARSPQGGP